MATNDDYSVEPFLGAMQSGAHSQEVASQLEALLNRLTQVRGQVSLLNAVAVRVEPGCLGRLLGKKSAWTRHDQVVVAPLSSMFSLGQVSLPSRSTSAATIAPESVRADKFSAPAPSVATVQGGVAEPINGTTLDVSAAALTEAASSSSPGQANHAQPRLPSTASALGAWASLPKGGRLLLGAIGIAAVVTWIYFSSGGSKSESQVARSAVVPTQQLPSPSTPPGARDVQSLPRTETRSLVQGRRADTPRVQVGDRWTTDVVDHQDARLNYRSERVVQVVQADRIVTTVRTLKSNYTRTVEYDGRWALVLSRLPTGASTTFAPALPYFNFPASPGATWQARVVETGTSGAQKIHEIRGNIGSWETVNVPAGSFSALKIVLADDISENGVVVQQGLDVSWYVPEVRRTVKTEESSFNPVSGERRQRTISLVEYSVR